MEERSPLLRRILKLSILGLVVLVLTLAAGGLSYRAWRQHQNATKLSIPSPPGIAEGQFVSIGGIDQWIQIRGDDVSNPVLLVLHGGPGSSYVPATTVFLPWERSFTVVQWDQRGTGRTFARNGRAGSGEMSVKRMTSDGIELIEYLRQHLHKDKVILYGTSWGTILGTTIAHRRPELLYAYVGSGQVVDMPQSETIGYDAVLHEAAQAGDAKAVSELKTIGPPPYKNIHALGVERRLFYQFAIPAERNFRKTALSTVLFAPGYSLKDMLDYNSGSEFSINALFTDMESTDLRALGTQFGVPMIFIQGADDTLTPTSLLEAYYASIEAPKKELILIPGAGHMVSLVFPDEILAQFLTHVRPLAEIDSR